MIDMSDVSDVIAVSDMISQLHFDLAEKEHT